MATEASASALTAHKTTLRSPSLRRSPAGASRTNAALNWKPGSGTPSGTPNGARKLLDFDGLSLRFLGGHANKTAPPNVASTEAVPATRAPGEDGASIKAAVTAAPPAPAGAPPLPVPRLRDMPLFAIISERGTIEPTVTAGGQATVFAIYDAMKKVQFVGFSQDLRNTLRRLIVRQPVAAQYYSAINVLSDKEPASAAQGRLLAARQQWFGELGGPPPGNRPDGAIPWTEAIRLTGLDTNAISAKVAGLRAAARSRGLKEELAFELAADTGALEVVSVTAPLEDEEAAPITAVKIAAQGVKAAAPAPAPAVPKPAPVAVAAVAVAPAPASPAKPASPAPPAKPTGPSAPASPLRAAGATVPAAETQLRVSMPQLDGQMDLSLAVHIASPEIAQAIAASGVSRVEHVMPLGKSGAADKPAEEQMAAAAAVAAAAAASGAIREEMVLAAAVIQSAALKVAGRPAAGALFRAPRVVPGGLTHGSGALLYLMSSADAASKVTYYAMKITFDDNLMPVVEGFAEIGATVARVLLPRVPTLAAELAGILQPVGADGAPLPATAAFVAPAAAPAAAAAPKQQLRQEALSAGSLSSSMAPLAAAVARHNAAIAEAKVSLDAWRSSLMTAMGM